MKKFLLAIFLSLCSFNVNAKFNKNHPINYTINEAIFNYEQNNDVFVIFYSGYITGMQKELVFSVISQLKTQDVKTFRKIDECAISLQIAHDMVYDKVKNGELSSNEKYSFHLYNIIKERYYKCAINKFLNQ